MTRLFRAVLALAVAAAFAFAPPGVSAKTTHSTMHSTHMKHSCPAGQHWVKGYKTKSGKKVHGHCASNPHK